MKAYVAAAGPHRATPQGDDVQSLLHKVGLRLTDQRMALASVLFKTKHRRVTAELLYDEAQEARCRVSRATVCSALRQFEQAGLLRRITVHGSKKAWFVVAIGKSRRLLKLASGR
jgi:Fe2+ or Zn2+ uptake regulation protein